jgi:hypothetical protein
MDFKDILVTQKLPPIVMSRFAVTTSKVFRVYVEILYVCLVLIYCSIARYRYGLAAFILHVDGLHCRISDLHMPVNELVRLVRIYSSPWEQKSQALKRLHSQYQSMKSQLLIALRKLEMQDGAVGAWKMCLNCCSSFREHTQMIER